MKCECEDPDIKCHVCHDGETVQDEIEPELVYKTTSYSALTQYEPEVETNLYKCPKCKIQYFERVEVHSGGAGAEQWKVLKDGKEVDGW